MTACLPQGWWFERAGARVTDFGAATAAIVLAEGAPGLRYRTVGTTAEGMPLARWVDGPTNLRLDGARIADGTSNTVFRNAAVRLGDGSVRMVTDRLLFADTPAGRDYAFLLGDAPPEGIVGADDAGGACGAGRCDRAVLTAAAPAARAWQSPPLSCRHGRHGVRAALLARPPPPPRSERRQAWRTPKPSSTRSAKNCGATVCSG